MQNALQHLQEAVTLIREKFAGGAVSTPIPVNPGPKTAPGCDLGRPSMVCGVVQSGGRLPGERGDRVEIFVDMQDVQPGKLGARRDD